MVRGSESLAASEKVLKAGTSLVSVEEFGGLPCAARCGQVIQDRWCGPRGRLMEGLPGNRRRNKPAQMAVPPKRVSFLFGVIAEPKRAARSLDPRHMM